MIQRFREGLMEFFYELSELVRRIRFARPKRRKKTPSATLKGNMHSVLVVNLNNDIFREAIFILRDDYLRTPGVSRETLLRQAQSAADDYLKTVF